MNKKYDLPAATGASSLLVIFAVLVLVVFALLSLGTAKAGDRLSFVCAESAKEYAEADLRAQEILALIREKKIPNGVSADGNRYEYSCDINDSLGLFVAVELDENGNYDILRWQSVRTSDWEADGRLDVWQSDN